MIKMKNYKENYLKAVKFEKPDFIPITFVINHACWDYYDHSVLFDLMETHHRLFPGFKRPTGEYRPELPLVARKDEPFRDDFGCLWKTTTNGITGTVVEHPLIDWDAFKNWKRPNPEVCMGIGPIDWIIERKDIEERRDKGELISCGLRHGHTFLQLQDIRGYENLIYDFVDEVPNVHELIDIVESFNLAIIRRYLDIGVDVMTYPEDLGMQTGPMLTPEQFRKYIKPSYQRLMKPAREAGVIIHMHSDGDIRELIDDIIEGGVDIINLQDNVNGIDWIAKRFSGRTCVELDIDRQQITVFGTPKEIDNHIARIVKTIGSPQGGLMMIFGLYPGTPVGNIRALMDAMEKYSG